MGKKISKLLTTIILLTLILAAGCSEESTEDVSGNEAGNSDDTNTSEESDEPVSASIGVGATGTAWYIFASAISQIASDVDSNFDLVVQGTGGGAENQRLVGNGEMEFGFAIAPDAGAAFEGEGPYEGEEDDFKMLRGVFAYPYGGTQIVTTDDSGIRTMSDLQGKSIAVGAPGSSGATFLNPIILGEHGITEENTSFEYLSVQAASDQLKNGQIDAMIIQQRSALSQIMDVSLTNDVRMISLEEDALEEISKQISGTYTEPLLADLYEDNQANEEDGITLGYAVVVATHSDMSEDAVYRFTKALFNNLDEFYKAHDQADSVTLEEALKGMTIPLHPGAMKYFEEQGIEIPDELIPEN